MSNNSNKYLAEYKKFVNKYYVSGKDKPYTHSIVGQPGGKYNIPAEEYDNFLTIYTKAYQTGGFYLVERPAEIGPLLIDLDFRQDIGDRQYTLEDIVYVVKYATSIIRKYFKINTKGEIRAFVFEKARASNHTDGGFKDGFHVMYPNIPMSINMRYLVLSEIRTLICKDGAFPHIQYKNDFVRDVFDTSVVKSNGWMMYGANKQNHLPYKLTHVYDVKMNELDIAKYKFAELVKLLGNRKFETHDEHEINDKIDPADLENKIERMLTQIRTKKEPTKNTVSKPNNKSKSSNNNNDDNDNDDNDGDNTDEEINEPVNTKKSNKSKGNPRDVKTKKYDDIQLATKLTELLSDSRATGYETWLHVGWALYNTSDKLLKTWKTFSQRTTLNNYNSSYCDQLWNEPKKEENKLTIGSLHVWARSDNPEKYGELMRDNISDILLDAETGTEYDIAKVMYELYGYRFVCADIDHNTWYEFQDNLWVNIQNGYTLHNLISEELVKEYLYLQSSIIGDMINKKGAEQESASKRNDNINKIITKLKKPQFKDGIVVECKRKFYDKHFEEKLDSNIHLIGFNNGIYDLENRCFRRGLPDDCVSFTVGYDYPEEYTVDHPDVKWVENFLSLVQTDPEMNTYLKMLLASYIDGSTANENFIIWTGKGANGKSKTMEFFTKAFGDYCSTLPVSILTANRPPNGAATPELAEMKGKRFVYFEEPEKTDNLKVGYMKELTGGSMITARKLYGHPIKFKPQFKLLLACNRLPVIDATDGGTWRRLRVTPFSSHFVKVDNPNAKNRKFTHKGQPLKKNQFPRDDSLSENMNTYKRAFAWLIINVYYPQYKLKGLVEPPTVLEYTQKYQRDNDIMHDFITSMLEITKNENDYETFVDVFVAYKSWIKENGNGSKVGTKNDISKYFEEAELDLKITSKNVYGVKFKDPNQNQEEKQEFIEIPTTTTSPLDRK